MNEGKELVNVSDQSKELEENIENGNITPDQLPESSLKNEALQLYDNSSRNDEVSNVAVDKFLKQYPTTVSDLVQEQVEEEKQAEKNKLAIAPLHSSMWNGEAISTIGTALGGANPITQVGETSKQVKHNEAGIKSHMSGSTFTASGGGGSHTFGGLHNGKVEKRKTISQHGGYGGTTYAGIDRSSNDGPIKNTGFATLAKSTGGAISSGPIQKSTSFKEKRIKLAAGEAHTLAKSSSKMPEKEQDVDIKSKLLKDAENWPTFKTGFGQEIKRTTKFTPLTLSKTEDGEILIGGHTLEDATPQEMMILNRSVR